MTTHDQRFSLDHPRLLESLLATDKLLIIQDLDGVCMGLVRDPLTRTIERRYVQAAARLAGCFQVLTNGEHIGSRGVNGIVDKAFDDPGHAGEHGLYLPGLAAGGVQLQDRFANVSHPGVSEAELAFLKSVPGKAERFLTELLSAPPYALAATEITALVDASVLDNLASPTLNLNSLYQRFSAQAGLYRQLQQAVADFMRALQQQASLAGLGDAFFVHYAPNLGHDAQGRERLKYSDGEDAGSTDFQFMLKGAIKEVGVLLILNHYYQKRTGHYPLGEHFNARQAPRDQDALLQLAREHFDPALMPRILAVGDTITSSRPLKNVGEAGEARQKQARKRSLLAVNEHSEPVFNDASATQVAFQQPANTRTLDGQQQQLRGGSDRGFLSLVQRLGEAFGSNNILAYIDSSNGEVARPGIDLAHLQRYANDPKLAPWPAFAGISDSADPLRLDVVFCGGHGQYVEFFCALAEGYKGR